MTESTRGRTKSDAPTITNLSGSIPSLLNGLRSSTNASIDKLLSRQPSSPTTKEELEGIKARIRELEEEVKYWKTRTEAAEMLRSASDETMHQIGEEDWLATTRNDLHFLFLMFYISIFNGNQQTPSQWFIAGFGCNCLFLSTHAFHFLTTECPINESNQSSSACTGL